MSKHFRPWKIDAAQLLPPRVADCVPETHLSRLIVALVRESLGLSAITASYTSGLGQPPFDPRMMTALLLNGYASGIYASRRIARAAVERADGMMIVAGDPPDFRTIAEFRKRHLQALSELFVQVLKLAQKAGLVTLGHVALDGRLSSRTCSTVRFRRWPASISCAGRRRPLTGGSGKHLAALVEACEGASTRRRLVVATKEGGNR